VTHRINWMIIWGTFSEAVDLEIGLLKDKILYFKSLLIVLD